MQKFYTSLLGQSEPTKTSIDREVMKEGPHLTMEQQLSLCLPFTDSEIEHAIFSIPNTKSPGLDGYSCDFFKASWNLIGPMVCAAVKSFFATSDMPSSISSTKLVLLPKVNQPQRASNFIPISYCNVIYKCISKLLCQE